jgi:rubredoxin
VSSSDPTTLVLTAAKSAYSAHYKESACSFVYRRSENDAWQQVCNGLPRPEGSRIGVVAASRVELGTFYCSTEGSIYRSADDGVQWQELGVKWSGVMCGELAFDMAIGDE